MASMSNNYLYSSARYALSHGFSKHIDKTKQMHMYMYKKTETKPKKTHKHRHKHTLH